MSLWMLHVYKVLSSTQQITKQPLAVEQFLEVDELHLDVI